MFQRRLSCLFFAMLLSHCQKPSKGEEPSSNDSTTEQEKESDSKDSPSSTKTLSKEEEFVALLKDCAESGKGSKVAKIADVIALINKLPKPVSIPCFLAALPRPFEMAATESKTSIQPARDRAHPRIFLHMNNLLISVASDGIGKDHVEFSELRGDLESIKGDLFFPMVENIPANGPYFDILDQATGKSACATCHANERVVTEGYPDAARISGAIRPRPETMLMRFEMDELNRQCDKNTTPTCLMTRAIYDQAAPGEFVFPNAMPLR